MISFLMGRLVKYSGPEAAPCHITLVTVTVPGVRCKTAGAKRHINLPSRAKNLFDTQSDTPIFSTGWFKVMGAQAASLHESLWLNLCNQKDLGDINHLFLVEHLATPND